jgi:hypothetical protein
MRGIMHRIYKATSRTADTHVLEKSDCVAQGKWQRIWRHGQRDLL